MQNKSTTHQPKSETRGQQASQSPFGLSLTAHFLQRAKYASLVHNDILNLHISIYLASRLISRFTFLVIIVFQFVYCFFLSFEGVELKEMMLRVTFKIQSISIEYIYKVMNYIYFWLNLFLR